MVVEENRLLISASDAKTASEKAAFKEQVELDITSVITELYADNQPVNLGTVIGRLVDTGREYKYTLTHIKNINESEETESDNVGSINIDGDSKTEYVKITKDGGEAKVDNKFNVEVEGVPTNVGGGTTSPVTPPTEPTFTTVANAPDNWYDYTEGVNQWANIKTMGGDNECYWVWIPRYSETSESETMGTENFCPIKDHNKSIDKFTIIW